MVWKLTAVQRFAVTLLSAAQKNAALPLLCLGLMGSAPLVLENVPELVDTISMEGLLRHHGVDVTRNGNTVTMQGGATNYAAPYELVRKMRASVLVLGPLLARYGEARVSLPGGCAIGTRPVDLHVRAMQALGAVVELADGYIQARAPGGVSGGRVVFPMVSVGAEIVKRIRGWSISYLKYSRVPSGALFA